MWTTGSALLAGTGSGKSDPYFSQVVLLVDGEGAGGASVTDRSALLHAGTLVGNAASSTTQKRVGGGSLLFDGSGDAVSFPSHSAFDFNTGLWTVDLYFMCTSLPAGFVALFIRRNSSSGVSPLSIGLKANGALSVSMSSDGATWQVDYTSHNGTFSSNTWYHVAVQLENGRLRVFVDGHCMYTQTGVTPMSLAHALGIGGNADGSSSFTGHIDFVRVTQGVARYSVPAPAQETTSLTNESSLLKFNSDLTDLGGLTWTAVGTAAVSTARSRYGAGSLLLDGSGDYIYVTGGSATWQIGTGDVTVECWINLSTLGKNNSISGQSTGGFSLAVSTANKLSWSQAFTGLRLTANTALTANRWYHVVATRRSGVLYIYLDGVLDGSVACTDSYSTSDCYVGGYPAVPAADCFAGYIDEFRLIKGTGWTPPPATIVSAPPYDAARKKSMVELDFDSIDTGLPISQDGNEWALLGNAALSSTQVKVGSKALYLDGAGDLAYNNSSLVIGTSAFTFDAYVYFAALPSNNSFTIFGDFDNYDGATTYGLAVQFRNDGGLGNRIRVSKGNTVMIDAPWTPSTTTWYHLAVCRSASGVVRVYVDGKCIGVATGQGLDISGSRRATFVGALSDWNGGSPQLIQYFNGYIDRLSFVLYDRYGTELSVSGPLTADAFDSSLFHFDSDLSDAVGKITWTPLGSIATSATQSKYGGSSVYIDSDAKYLQASSPPTNYFQFGAEDFTIEFWAYPTAYPASIYMFVDFRPSVTNGDYLMLGLLNSSKSWVWHTNDTYYMAVQDSAQLNVWQHVAFSRSRGYRYWHLNGRLMYWEPDSVSYTTSGDRPVLFTNGWQVGNNNPRGYVDELRITRGRARFPLVQNATPKVPFRRHDPSYSKVVSHIYGAGPDTGTAIHDLKGIPITRGSGTTTSTTTAKFGSSSMKFTAASSYLSINNSALNSGTSDFTWEAWVNSQTTAAWSRLYETSAYNSAVQGWHFSFNGTDTAGARRIGFQLAKSGGGGARLESDAAFPNAAWSHLAVVRKNHNIFMLIDGKLQSTTLPVDTETWNSNTQVIGSALDFANGFSGYIQDFRVTAGENRYGVGFHNTIPPTSQASVDRGTVISLLTFESGDLTDATSRTWTGYGSAAVNTAASKFGSYSLSLPASSYILGDGNAAWQFGAGDFTIDFWINITVTSGCVFDFRGTGQDVSQNLTLFNNYGGSNNWYLYCNGAWVFQVTDNAITTGQWFHIAITRRAGVIYFFRDGVLLYKGAFTNTLTCGTSRPAIGSQGNSIGTFLQCRIDDFRAVGEAMFFLSRAPTSAPEWSQGTISLLNFDGNTNDANPTVVWTTNGSAALSTTYPKFGTGCMYFPGTSADYLSTPHKQMSLLSNGDWCVECWVKPTSAPANSGGIWAKDGSVSGMLLRLRTAMDGFEFVYPGLQQSATLGSAVRLNAWTHICVFRLGTSHYFFQDGVGGPFSISNRTADASTDFVIGRSNNTGNYAPFIGYIDGFRVSAGQYPFMPLRVPHARDGK